ncbi:MAG: thiamine-phosphate diphosphorylase [Chloroflexi bacterium RBG_13_51_36]|nr:MAG: thiamine-phosphate diphosphorylase [Chloroflexi bacterium RBG_13_51_36]
MIDANLNRSSEGLRVLEDVARFVLNDAEFSQRLRSLRHGLAREVRVPSVRLLSHRDSGRDVGGPHSRDNEPSMGTTSLQGLADLVTANAKRIEESLRVMEELAKLPELSAMLNSASFERTRFAVYRLERELISRISRRDKAERISGLYVILDRQFLAGRDELDTADQIVQGGARVIQFRDKQSEKGEMLLVAQKLKALCNRAGVLFIVNDYLDLAMAVDADGLHIGQQDLPLPVVRRQLPIDKIVGCSVTTVAQATKAQNEGADYIAVGSIFPTTTKKEATVVGVNMLKELKRVAPTPLVAIGGINRNNISKVIAAGADAVAVISAVLGEKDVKGAVQKLAAEMDLVKGKCQNQQKT